LQFSEKQAATTIEVAELEDFCRRANWTASHYADSATGDARASRPGRDRLLKDAQRKPIDVVVVSKLECFGRSLRASRFRHVSSPIEVPGRIKDYPRIGVTPSQTTELPQYLVLPVGRQPIHHVCSSAIQVASRIHHNASSRHSAG